MQRRKQLAVRFQEGQPVRLALRWTDGREICGGAVRRFVLTDGRALFLQANVAAKLAQLEPQPGEELVICKRLDRGRVRWEMQRTAGRHTVVSVGAVL
jgi:hypothetical protein